MLFKNLLQNFPVSKHIFPQVIISAKEKYFKFLAAEFWHFFQYQVASNQTNDFIHLYPTFAELENGFAWPEHQNSINQAYNPNRQLYPKYFNHTSMNKIQNYCSRCTNEIQVEKGLSSAGSSITGIKECVVHIGAQTDNYNTKQMQNESVTVILPSLLNVEYITPIFQDIKPRENHLNLHNHNSTIVNGDFPAASNLNFQLSSNLNPTAAPFHPRHTNSLIPFSPDETIHNKHSIYSNADNSFLPSSSSNNAVNFSIHGVNDSNSMLTEIHPLNGFQSSLIKENHNIKYENQHQPTCSIQFSALQSKRIHIVPLLHQTSVQLQNQKETAITKIETKCVLKKCYVKVEDSFKFVTKTMLEGIVHVITYNNDDYFLVDEVVYGLFGITSSIVQIRKMFVGTQNMIPAFIRINLNKFQSLKQELLAYKLTQESTVWINVAAVSCLLYFVTFLNKMPKSFYICN